MAGFDEQGGHAQDPSGDDVGDVVADHEGAGGIQDVGPQGVYEQARTGFSAGAGTLILTFAWLKARLILGRYLRLDAAPFWRRGFGISLGLFCLLLLGLYLAPSLL